MKILIISDTHGADENFEKVFIREAPFDLLIHCGDTEGREEYIELSADCPAYLVRGNCDYASDLPSEVVVEIGNHRALVTHGHYYDVYWGVTRLAEAARARNCDMAFFGHIHRPVEEIEGGVYCINPGSLTYPRQISGVPTYAVLELDESKAAEAGDFSDLSVKFIEKGI